MRKKYERVENAPKPGHKEVGKVTGNGAVVIINPRASYRSLLDGKLK